MGTTLRVDSAIHCPVTMYPAQWSSNKCSRTKFSAT